MDNTVYRQAAIDAINSYFGFNIEEEYGSAVQEVINGLPSAQPEKKGKWIPHEDEDGEHYGDKCSECGEWYVMPYGKTNFCPNCGARMEGFDETD